MYRKLFFALFLSFFTLCFNAQEVEEVYGNYVFEFQKDSVETVFVDKSRLRSAPNVNAPAIDTIATGEKVQILEKTNQLLKLGSRAAYWYKVDVLSNATGLPGYIWGGNLSIARKEKNGVTFLMGIPGVEKRVVEKDTLQSMVGEVKAMKGTTVLDATHFYIDTSESTVTSFIEIQGNKGLPNVEEVITAGVSGEACGVPTYEQTLLWQNNQFTALPLNYSVADADVYWHGESYVFPTDKGGKKNRIIKVTEQMEMDDNDKKITHPKEKEFFEWNGSTVNKVKN